MSFLYGIDTTLRLTEFTDHWILSSETSRVHFRGCKGSIFRMHSRECWVYPRLISFFKKIEIETKNGLKMSLITILGSLFVQPGDLTGFKLCFCYPVHFDSKSLQGETRIKKFRNSNRRNSSLQTGTSYGGYSLSADLFYLYFILFFSQAKRHEHTYHRKSLESV